MLKKHAFGSGEDFELHLLQTLFDCTSETVLTKRVRTCTKLYDWQLKVVFKKDVMANKSNDVAPESMHLIDQ